MVADNAVLVSEASIIAGMRMLLDHAGLVVEPSAAFGIAAILEDRDRFAGRQWSPSCAAATSTSTAITNGSRGSHPQVLTIAPGRRAIGRRQHDPAESPPQGGQFDGDPQHVQAARQSAGGQAGDDAGPGGWGCLSCSRMRRLAAA